MSNLQKKNISPQPTQDCSKRQIKLGSFNQLIGVPYAKKDCWQIVVDFYQLVFEIQLKNYYDKVPENRDIAKSIVYSNMGDFEEVKDRKFGDLLLIKLFGVESHIAVYLDNGLMLHTTNHSGCVVDRIARWEKLIVGTYRIKPE